MQLEYNTQPPTIMHIDLNSCFAIIEQQANPLLRHKPVAVAAYDTPGGMILASSYEAKAKGVKLGVNVREARQLAPNICIRMPDPAKYRDAHKRFKRVLLRYTNDVHPKSIDEFVLNLARSPAQRSGATMQAIGQQIKQDIKQALGNYVTVNVGIGTNRFLAKMAAGLNKPDGLDTITGHTLRDTLATLTLLDITGINVRYQARLNTAGIYTPLEFLDAPAEFLAKRVFKSKVGYNWYARLRGWEVDAVQWGTKSVGHQYALSVKTADRRQLAKILAKLCEKTGRRMRAQGYSAHGVHLALRYVNNSYWARGRGIHSQLYASQDIFLHAHRLLNEAPASGKISHMSVSVYKLLPTHPQQQSLFAGSTLDSHSLTDATDTINDRYGEFSIAPGIMTGIQDIILDRIAFGSVGHG